MKQCLFIVTIIIHTGIALGQQLLFYEEFNGNQLNNNDWHTQPTWGPQVNWETSYETFKPENIEVSNGTLKLHLKWEPDCYEVSIYPENCSNCSSSCINGFSGNCNDPIICSLNANGDC